MLHTYTATDIRALVRAWMQCLRQDPPAHPFDPITVIVPNMDMARWLQLQLAESTGFSGNMHFVLPAAWLRTRFESAHPQAKQLLLDKTHLQWMLNEILLENSPDSPWTPVQEWITRIGDRAAAESDALAKARWDIASQLADAFDQYIMYRPDWLLAWQGTLVPAEDALGELPSGEESRWQAALWREVVRRWPDIPNRATLLYQFLSELRQSPDTAAERASSSPPSKAASGESDPNMASATMAYTTTATTTRVYAFGLSALPLPTMLAMARHARHTEWHWFSQRHTISDQSYLTELNSYTREQAATFQDILIREGVAGPHTNVQKDDVTGAVPHSASNPNSANNLQRLQHAAVHDTPFEPLPGDPDAIRLHICHSARREVEVLYDTLLDVFNTTDVRPGDVAIVTPDPDAYRPFIEEVFRGGGMPNSIQPAIHVAGARRNAGDVGAEVMLGALNLIGTRYKVPEVLDWLEAEPVLGALTDRSGLRHTLHNWVMRQRIRWGIDVRQLTRAGFPLSGRHTWRHGIDRLLLSWMAAEGEDIVINEILTGSTVAGQETGILLGRLAAVIQALSDLQETSETPQTLRNWCAILETFTSEVFTTTDAGREYAATVQKTLAQLRQTSATLHLDQPVPFTIVRSYLDSALATAGLGRAWRPGTITFTGMVALHQLPFRVIAILGLNDGKLPGKTPVSAFDLIPEFPRPADRSRRDADRQLFLDYLLTPDLRLHLSYTGMRQKDNKDLAPSVMLTMLEDFIAEKLPADRREFRQNLRVRHALQPFSPKYFTPEGAGSASHSAAASASPTLFSYSPKHRDLAAALSAPRTPRAPLFPSDAHPTEATISDSPDTSGSMGTPNTTGGSGSPFSSGNPGTPGTELTLYDVQQFFRNPVKALLRTTPGLNLEESDVPGESAEPFAFDNLTGWQVRTQVMRSWLETGDLAYSAVETYLRRDGILAEGPAGRRQMRVLVAELQDFVRYFESELGDKPAFSTLETDVAVTTSAGITYRISAMYPFVFGRNAWNFEASQASGGFPASKKVRHYVAHLVLNVGQPMQSRIVFRDRKELVFRPMTSDEALLRLGNLMGVYECGLQRPLPFFPACMQQYTAGLREGLTPRDSLDQLLDDISGEPGMFAREHEKELDSIWVQEAFGDTHPLEPDVQKPLCGLLKGAPRPISADDLTRFDLFSLVATRIIDVMNSDMLKEAQDMSAYVESPSDGLPSAAPASAAASASAASAPEPSAS